MWLVPAGVAGGCCFSLSGIVDGENIFSKGYKLAELIRGFNWCWYVLIATSNLLFIA